MHKEKSGLICNRQGAVLEIVLNDAPLNTLKLGLLAEMTTAFAAEANAVPDKRARVIVVRSSAPGVLSYGLDPQELLAETPDGRAKIFQALLTMCEAALKCPLPIIVDVGGAALAGGAVLASLGDFVIFNAAHGKLCYSEVKVGLAVPDPIIALAGRHVSPGVLVDMIGLGRNYSAKELKECGFAHFVYDDAKARDAWLADYVSKVERLDPEVIGATFLELRRGVLLSCQAFLSKFNTHDIRRFLGDEFLGKGLKDMLRKMSAR